MELCLLWDSGDFSVRNFVCLFDLFWLLLFDGVVIFCLGLGLGLGVILFVNCFKVLGFINLILF